MNTNEVVKLLKKLVADQKAKGDRTLSITGMEAALDELERLVLQSPSATSNPADLEHYKAMLTSHLDHQKRIHEVGIEMLRATITTGQAALKTALLINGGATAALLAFIGQVWSSGKVANISAMLAFPVSLYAVGVLSAGLAAAATYFSQAGYAKEFGKHSRTIGRFAHAAAIAFVMSSYALFGAGTLQAGKILTLGS